MTSTSSARTEWEQRVYDRTGSFDLRVDLPTVSNLRAEPAVGHIALFWDEVPGAAGYLVKCTWPDGLTEVLDHGGGDVRAVAATSFALTGVQDGTDLTVEVAAVPGADLAPGGWSAPVTARARQGDPGVVRVRTDASGPTVALERPWEMVGSERLSQLLLAEEDHGHVIGAEFLEALRVAGNDLGVRQVRAHAIFHDDLGVARRSASGALELDFSKIDALYDMLLDVGLRPVVEFSFMPADLARDPRETVFTYRGHISPPRDWGEWHDLVGSLAAHLVGRYGRAEVTTWPFEVWNEPNLAVFWTGTREEYLRLYDESAHALKEVDPEIKVGGPSSAAAEWVEALAAHAEETGVPLDFVSTHTYGNYPLDLRPALARHGFDGIPIYWTEWGVGSTHFGPVHDSVFGAPFLLGGYAAARGMVTSLSHWVVSDHFEELGRPPRLFHDGFGLLSVGNLRKPRYWAAHLAAHQGRRLLRSEIAGDGANVLVQASATLHEDGTVEVLVWNGTINAALFEGDHRLDRRVTVEVSGLTAGAYDVRLARIDQTHSNIVGALPSDIDWPDEATWVELRKLDVLHEADLPRAHPAEQVANFEIDLPMPGVARLRLDPGQP